MKAMETQYYCNRCKSELPAVSRVCPNCGFEQDVRLKWHRFVCGALFLSAALSVLMGIQQLLLYFQARKYFPDSAENTSLLVYSIILFVLCAGFAYFPLRARQLLRAFKAGAPEYYLRMRWIFLGINLAAALVLACLSHKASDFLSELPPAALNIGFTLIMRSYYGIRAHLFTE